MAHMSHGDKFASAVQPELLFYIICAVGFFD